MLRSRRFVKFVISIIRSPLERRDRVSSSHCCDCVLRLRDPSRIQGQVVLTLFLFLAFFVGGNPHRCDFLRFHWCNWRFVRFRVDHEFVFFLGLFLLLAFLPMLSVIATKQAANIKNLTQRLAIIEKEIVRDC